MGVQINGSEGNVIATKGTFSGDVGIGGTLTYEDVTNIDSVGLVTARSGIEIGARPGVAASISVDGNMIVSGVTTFTPGGSEVVRINSGGLLVYNDVSFFGDSTNAYWDKSANQFLLNDNTKLSVGSSSDLEIYHNGTHSYLSNATGNLFVEIPESRKFQVQHGSEAIINGYADDRVELYHDNSKKLETTSSGVSITGNIESTGHLDLTDSGRIKLGTDDDLQLYHDGSNASFNITTGQLFFQRSGASKILFDTNGDLGFYDNRKAYFGDGADMKLYHDGTTNYIECGSANFAIRVNSGNRIEINGTSGDVIMQGSGGKNFTWDNSSAYLNLNDSALLTLGTDNDLQIGHNNSDSNILHNGTGDMYIGTGGSGERLFFQTAGSAKWRMNPGGALKAGTHIDGGDGSHGDDYHMHITANFSPQKACMLLEDYSYYSDAEALRINNSDTNSGREMEDVQFTRVDTLVGYIRIHSTSTSYNTSGSDRRLKKNFEDWTEDNLSKFKTLSPQLFNWNTEEDGAAKTKGFIAQDNLEKFPEAYPKTIKTDRYYFNPSGMVHYLMKAMQEAAVKIETLEAEVAALKSN